MSDDRIKDEAERFEMRVNVEVARASQGLSEKDQTLLAFTLRELLLVEALDRMRPIEDWELTTYAAHARVLVVSQRHLDMARIWERRVLDFAAMPSVSPWLM